MSTLFRDPVQPDAATLPAISLWQPWASLWMIGRKRCETRHWPIKIRGLLAVHAAQRLETDLPAALLKILRDEFGADWPTDLPRGCLLGTLEIRGCYPTDTFNPFHAEERVQGNFEPGRYAWVGQSREPLEVPVRWRGRQGIFRVPARLFEVGEGT